MNKDFEKSRQLIKEATLIKNSDITKSIELIKEAISICPEQIIADSFKLSNYYHKSGDKEIAYKILFQLLDDTYNKNLLTMYNMSKSMIYEKICVLKYSDKLYSEYIFYFSIYRYHTNLAVYTQGRKSDYQRNKNNYDEFGFTYFSKIRSCFKKINSENKMNVFSKSFSNFFSNNEDSLKIVIDKAYEALMSTDYNFNKPETTGERADRILRSDEIYIQLINKLSEEKFIEYYNLYLTPLIKK